MVHPGGCNVTPSQVCIFYHRIKEQESACSDGTGLPSVPKRQRHCQKPGEAAYDSNN